MPKRSRGDSSSFSSRSPTPDPSSPASIATPSHSSKYLHTSGDVAYKAMMKCSLPPHAEALSFSTYEEFEIHYAKIHAHRCFDCRRNFPTEHFLELHIGENHDPLNEARRAKGEKTVSAYGTNGGARVSSLVTNCYSTAVSLKTVIRSAPLHRSDACISQTNTCSQRQANKIFHLRINGVF